MFINLQVAPLELRFRASDSGTFEPVDFPRHADSRFVAGEHGRTKPVTIHIITSRLNRFDDSLVLLIEGPRLPGAHAVIDLRIVLTKISRRAIEIVAAGLGLGRDDVRTQGVYGLLARCPGDRKSTHLNSSH